MKTVSEIISLWPRTADFAEDCGVEWMTAHQWRRRNKIPPEHWAALVKAAKRRGFVSVTEKSLADMAAAKKRAVPKASKKREIQAVSA